MVFRKSRVINFRLHPRSVPRKEIGAAVANLPLTDRVSSAKNTGKDAEKLDTEKLDAEKLDADKGETHGDCFSDTRLDQEAAGRPRAVGGGQWIWRD